MLMLTIVVLGIAAVPLADGRFTRLVDVRLRLAWALLAALAVQVLITTLAPGGAAGWHAAAHVGSYLLAGAFLVANRRLPFVWLLALGAALNLLAIVANGGVMPADPGALQRAGWPVATHQFENSTALTHPRLLFLGDVFAVPKQVPLANVFSVGDVLLVLGGVLVLHRLCGSRLLSRALRLAR